MLGAIADFVGDIFTKVTDVGEPSLPVGHLAPDIQRDIFDGMVSALNYQRCLSGSMGSMGGRDCKQPQNCYNMAGIYMGTK